MSFQLAIELVVFFTVAFTKCSMALAIKRAKKIQVICLPSYGVIKAKEKNGDYAI